MVDVFQKKQQLHQLWGIWTNKKLVNLQEQSSLNKDLENILLMALISKRWQLKSHNNFCQILLLLNLLIKL